MSDNMRSDVKHREMMEIHNLPAVYADRMYITPKRMAVILSFCEDIPNAEENKVRARVGMTLEVFMHFADMMAKVAQQVRDHQTKQSQTVEGEEETAKVVN